MENRKNSIVKSKLIITVIITIIIIPLIYSYYKYRQTIDLSIVENFATIFISVVLEAMPFILLGSFISALIQEFISDELIKKIIPKNKFLGFFGASLMGLIFPVCECAIVPITKGLIKKGVPVGIATTFMLSVPIVNPIVLISTYYAFYDMPSMVLIRGGFGLLVAIIIGLLMDYSEKGKNLQIKEDSYEGQYKCYCGCDNDNGLYFKHSKVRSILEHTSKELLNISKYLIFGAMLSAIFQVTVSKQYTAAIGQHPYYSILTMMALAFILSICSEADAFIGRSFLGQFTTGSVATFLILGPMLDIKNTFMLIGNFRVRVVIKLIIYITLVTFFIGCVINILESMGVV